jgi:ABC-type antimicrobial peptide transport system permease subunit
LISCINFTTISVGRSSRRAREVGVRKAIGGSDGDLRLQFLMEAFLMTLISFVLGFALAHDKLFVILPIDCNAEFTRIVPKGYIIIIY